MSRLAAGQFVQRLKVPLARHLVQRPVVDVAGGEPLCADRPFYPILLSAYGYESVFGYAGDLVGRLDGNDVTAPTGEERSAKADGRNR